MFVQVGGSTPSGNINQFGVIIPNIWKNEKFPKPQTNYCYGPHPTASAFRPSKGLHQTHLWPHGDEGVEVEQRTWSKLGAPRLANPIPKFENGKAMMCGPEKNHRYKKIRARVVCEIMFITKMRPNHLIPEAKMFEATGTLPLARCLSHAQPG